MRSWQDIQEMNLTVFSDMKNKKVLISGASGGIGQSIAGLFADFGANIGLHYNSSTDEAEKLQKRISGNGVRAELFQGNLLDANVRSELVDSFVSSFGGIDILINNAGAVYDYKDFSQLDEQAWDNTYGLNVKAPFFLIRQAFEQMKENEGGRIINITTASAKYGGGSNNMHYVASKAALDTLTLGFARAGSKYNILVNSIRCGIIDTPMRTRIDGYSEQRFEQRVSLVPLGRAGQAIDIARMALFLASEGGDYITGQTFAVSGGE